MNADVSSGLRAAIVAEARRWIGTPYRHGASVRLVGCDCLGLVAGVARTVFGNAAVPPIPAYPPDWAEARREEWLLDALAGAMRRIDGEAAMPGDVLVFRWREQRPASHLAIMVGERAIVHAHARASVAEVALGTPWRRRIAAGFAFREVF